MVGLQGHAPGPAPVHLQWMTLVEVVVQDPCVPGAEQEEPPAATAGRCGAPPAGGGAAAAVQYEEGAQPAVVVGVVSAAGEVVVNGDVEQVVAATPACASAVEEKKATAMPGLVHWVATAAAVAVVIVLPSQPELGPAAHVEACQQPATESTAVPAAMHGQPDVDLARVQVVWLGHVSKEEQVRHSWVVEAERRVEGRLEVQGRQPAGLQAALQVVA